MRSADELNDFKARPGLGISGDFLPRTKAGGHQKLGGFEDMEVSESGARPG